MSEEHTDGRKPQSAQTTLGSLFRRPVPNGMNTDGLLAPGLSGTYSVSAVHIELGVYSWGSGVHRDS